MKKFKKGFAVIFIAVFLFSITGCSVRKSISSDKFKAEAQKEGFTISEQTSSDASVDNYLIASKKGSDTKIVYLSFEDSSSAHDRYAASIGDLVPSGGKDAVDSDTYNKYSVSKGELYYTITRIDATIIYCTTTVTKKDEADSFMKVVNY